ncbi:8-oxo-dGDP phosphatase NUDT18 [Ammospiza nelsoni]|uniref:8-oxo-dGDP phosphatase NUDT18 n=1 Tax=Ammospiza caudacuta TaxID=2857398 RepID=UPI002739D555|nr:8-oxo-dGDP phosphatase NUDT18 [Ammospiza caudacuta]XP_059346834.1 8-oxo-dGDP phosphatase NUDT18 [Ammospiza nelsoni]
MGDAPEPELEAVLDGGAWELGETLGGTPAPVRLGRNVCYVVLAVLFNQEGSLLLVQEAKPECRGLWYLPAGRVERGEPIVAALRREVREESGLLCEPETLLALEERGPAWIRFSFLARATGGTLKTLQDADSESLQATWWRGDPRSLPLRSADILPVLELAARYRRSPAHPPTLPRELPCSPLCLRLLLPFSNASGELWLLLAAAATPQLPVVACGTSPAELRAGLRPPLLRLLRERLGWEAQPAALGLLGLQHSPGDAGDTDGICFNVLLSVAPGGQRERPPEPRDPALRWWPVREELRGRVLQRMRASVPVRS